MLPSKALGYIRNTYEEYPLRFWILLLGTFIDRLGAALVFPFLTLYITDKFGVGMTEVGLGIGVFSLTNMLGAMLGGALTDRVGRKVTLVFGLVVSALTSLLLGMADSVGALFASLCIVGLFANVGGPAQQAMVADLLPDEKRAQGFSLLRVVANLSFAIGAAIGGLLAVRSYLLLFIADAVTSLITAAIAYAFLVETKPASRGDARHETILQTLRGYRVVARDAKFVAFGLVTILPIIVSLQMNTTLGVYLRNTRGVSAQRFGYILSLNATMVVLLQFYITRRLQGWPPFIVMAVGCLLYGLGFSLYGFVTAYGLFLLAMAIITIGEMLTFPTAQALVARMAPEDMRGRYMASFGFTWTIAAAVGPLLAGLIMDRADPRWVWYCAGLVDLVATLGFSLLHRWIGVSVTDGGTRTAGAVDDARAL